MTVNQVTTSCEMGKRRQSLEGNRSTSKTTRLGSLRSHARSIGSLPSLPTACSNNKPKVAPLSDVASPSGSAKAETGRWNSPARVARRVSTPLFCAAARKVAPSPGCSTPSAGCSPKFGRSRSASDLSACSRSSSLTSPSGTPAARASRVSDVLRGGRSSPITLLRKKASSAVKPLDEDSMSAEGADDATTTPSSRPSSGSSSRGSMASFPGTNLIPACGSDVVEVCRLARAMHVPVLEMQEPYSLFKEHAEPVSDGASLLKDGRLTKEQFGKLVREHFFGGSATEAARYINRAFMVADASGKGELSFEEFSGWMVNHTFDENLNTDASEREMRNLAKEYRMSVIEVDKYKRLFEQFDQSKSGKIEACQFEDVLNKCGNITRDIGLSAARRQSLWRAADPRGNGTINFEEFLVFNLKYFATGAKGFDEFYS